MADIDPPVDDIFAGMKKKKKGTKKTINFDSLDLDAPSAGAPSSDANSTNAAATDAPAPADDELDFSSIKKKKKKSVRIDSDPEDEPSKAPVKATKFDKLGNEVEDDAAAPAAATEVPLEAANDGADEFADLIKKKKKKSSKKAFDLEAFEKELAAESESAGASEEVEAAPKSILKKKEKKEVGSDGEEEEDEEDEVVEGEDPFGAGEGVDDEEEGQVSKAEQAAQAKDWLKSDRDYTYTEVCLSSLPLLYSSSIDAFFPTQLLGRFFSLLYQSHPSLSGGAGKKKYTIPPPQLFREGNKRSIFANIADICKRMHRQPEHVIQFLFAELGTNGSVDGSARLVIKGRFQQSASTFLLLSLLLWWWY
jgi:translation initiation factor 2 subunit 2